MTLRFTTNVVKKYIEVARVTVLYIFGVVFMRCALRSVYHVNNLYLFVKKMKIVFNTKIRNVFRAICMDEDELGNPQIFWEKGKIYKNKS